MGTLDIERAIKKGERRFDAGVLAAANRGLLYIDEVNLLDDHVVDLLLDAAALGVNIVEREGISFSHPAQFILVGTMNPEEGELRPQLLDRFARAVEVRGIEELEPRMEVMERTLAFQNNKNLFLQRWRSEERSLAARITKARSLVDRRITYTKDDIKIIAALTTQLEVDGHRADLVILRTASTLAAYQERTEIALADIAQAAMLALPHRVNKGPFQKEEINLADIEERLAKIRGGKRSATKKKTAVKKSPRSA